MLAVKHDEQGRIWVQSCGKWRYPTRPIAMDALVGARAKGRSERAVHYCYTCAGWHLTHKIQWEVNNNAPDARHLIEEERGIKLWERK